MDIEAIEAADAIRILKEYSDLQITHGRDGSKFAAIASLIETESAEVRRLREALKPFAGCVFNDNGDMTVSYGSFNMYEHCIAAYFAMKQHTKDTDNDAG